MTSLRLCTALLATSLVAGPALAEEEAPPAAPAVSPQRSWIDFESTDGSFSISMPGQPAEKVTETPVEGKSIKTTTYTLNLGPGGFYLASYTDNPGLKVTKPEATFDAVQKELAKQGTILDQSDISVDGFPGREIGVEMTAKSPGDILSTVRVFVVGGRLYQTLTTNPKAKTSRDEQKKFLDSFKLLKKP